MCKFLLQLLVHLLLLSIVCPLPSFLSPKDEALSQYGLFPNSDYVVTRKDVRLYGNDTRTLLVRTIYDTPARVSWVTITAMNSTAQADLVHESSINTLFRNIDDARRIWFVKDGTIWTLYSRKYSHSIEVETTSMGSSLSDNFDLNGVRLDNQDHFAVFQDLLFILEEKNGERILRGINLIERGLVSTVKLSSMGEYNVTSMSVMERERLLVVVMHSFGTIEARSYSVHSESLELRKVLPLGVTPYPGLIATYTDLDNLYITFPKNLTNHVVNKLSFSATDIQQQELIQFENLISSRSDKTTIIRFGNTLVIAISHAIIYIDMTSKLVNTQQYVCNQGAVFISPDEYICFLENSAKYFKDGTYRSQIEFSAVMKHEKLVWHGYSRKDLFYMTYQEIIRVILTPKFSIDTIYYYRLPNPLTKIGNIEVIERTIYFTSGSNSYLFDMDQKLLHTGQLCSKTPDLEPSDFLVDTANHLLMYLHDENLIYPTNDTCLLPVSSCDVIEHNKFIDTKNGAIIVNSDNLCITDFSSRSSQTIRAPSTIQHILLYNMQDSVILWWNNVTDNDVSIIKVSKDELANVYTTTKKQVRRLFKPSSTPRRLCDLSYSSADNLALLVICYGSQFERIILTLDTFKVEHYLGTKPYSEPYVISCVGQRVFSVTDQKGLVTILRIPSNFDDRDALFYFRVVLFSGLAVVLVLAGIMLVISLLFLKFGRSGKKRTSLLMNDELSDVFLDHDYHARVSMIPIEDLRLEKPISEGVAGVVWLGMWKTTRTKVAIKKLKFVGEMSSAANEVAILNKLRHPNIVLFCGISIDSRKTWHIVSEYVENGNLDDLIYKSSKKTEGCSFKEKLQILVGISKGITYLHSREPQIIHRDLKPQNILIDRDLTPKICDFGLSKLLSGKTFTMTPSGTQGYISPEILEAKEYTEKTDVYSFGIMMHELFFVAKPYRPVGPSRALLITSFESAYSFGKKVLEGLRPEIPFSLDDPDTMEQWYNDCNRSDRNTPFNYQVMKSYFALMQNCWKMDADQRPAFCDICDELEALLASLPILLSI